MRVSSFEIEELLGSRALANKGCYLSQAPIDDVGECSRGEYDGSLKFKRPTAEYPIFRECKVGHVAMMSSAASVFNGDY